MIALTLMVLGCRVARNIQQPAQGKPWHAARQPSTGTLHEIPEQLGESMDKYWNSSGMVCCGDGEGRHIQKRKLQNLT